MKTEHTQGTWNLIDCHDDTRTVDIKAGNKNIATVYAYNKGKIAIDFHEQQANAKLIAAAPSMLKSLLKLRRETEYLLNELATNKYLTEVEQIVLCKNFLGATSELATDEINQAINP